jgi:ketol-acid reductoisomerase
MDSTGTGTPAHQPMPGGPGPVTPTRPVYHDDEADLSTVQGRSVAVIGYGGQGRAHALCLRDSGVPVRVGLPDGVPEGADPAEEGLSVGSLEEVAAGADLVVVLAPDSAHSAVLETVAPWLTPGTALCFGHAATVCYGLVSPPSDVDVLLVAATAPGPVVREAFTDGRGVPVLVAVEQDVTGQAWPLALAYAKAIGGTRAGAIATTFAEQADTDLFAAQVVRSGGAAALVQAGFEVLVEAGYAPELAVLQCLRAWPPLVELMASGGLSGMRASLADSDEYGDYTRGPRVVDARTRARMRRILAEIQRGGFTREWLAEDRAGRPNLASWREQAAAHPIEQAGRALRAVTGW